MKDKNPMMVAAGKKAWETRRRNAKMIEDKGGYLYKGRVYYGSCEYCNRTRDVCVCDLTPPEAVR
jgi:hypothetical protein